jgi:hypothetical protein
VIGIAFYLFLIEKETRTLFTYNPLTGRAVPGSESIGSPGSGSYLMVMSLIVLELGFVVMRWVRIRGDQSPAAAGDPSPVAE